MHEIHKHKNISRLIRRCWPTCGQSASAQKAGQVEQIHLGMGRSISNLHYGPMQQIIWEVPETHRNIWHTCRQSTGTQYQTKLSKNMVSGEVNILASIRAPCTKFGLEVSETHKNMFRLLEGVDLPVGRALVPRIQAKFSKYMGSGEV